MSNQPSTTDQIKETAQSTYDILTKTIAPSSTQNKSADGTEKSEKTKDAQGQECRKGDFQDQLSKASKRNSRLKEGGETYVEKVVSAIPFLSKPQEKSKGNETATSNSEDSRHSEIKRPDHDVQVEEFLRKQYMSTSGMGMHNSKNK